MKYIVLLSDGMSGEPLEELGNRTTMEAADTPNMDRLVKDSVVGLVQTVPKGMSPGSDVANLAALGYNPKKYYSGRSPLEALSIGVDMKDTDVSLRMNLVTLTDEEVYEEKVITDHSSGEITTEEAAILLEDLKVGLRHEGYDFYLGTSYRHLVIIKNGEIIDLVPPHDVLERQIGAYLPKNQTLRDMMIKSYEILKTHPINKKRIANGENPANSVWFWGAGKRPELSSFKEKTGKSGVMISAVDLLKGIAVGAGMKVAKVEGINGGLHTNYEGKALAAIDSLCDKGCDFAYIHVEAPDEMGHQGLIKEKIQAIENVDKRVLKILLDELEKRDEDFRIMILPDHPTPVAIRTHTGNPVPFMIYDSTNSVRGTDTFSEKTAKKQGLLIDEGYKLIDELLK
ncbi:MAG: cofactor-independent phosphoglycerate mutase [Suipraeoptans sp.]